MRNSTSPASHDKRRTGRYPVTDVIEVFDVFAERPMGTLVNISTAGLMLSSEGVVPLGQIFQVTLRVARSTPGDEPICLGIESLWHRESADGARYWTGFQLIAISERDQARLEEMLGGL